MNLRYFSIVSLDTVSAQKTLRYLTSMVTYQECPGQPANANYSDDLMAERLDRCKSSSATEVITCTNHLDTPSPTSHP